LVSRGGDKEDELTRAGSLQEISKCKGVLHKRGGRPVREGQRDPRNAKKGCNMGGSAVRHEHILSRIKKHRVDIQENDATKSLDICWRR